MNGGLGGALSTTIQALELNNNVTIEVTNTSASDVNIGTVTFNAGKTLTLSGTGSLSAGGDLIVRADGNTITKGGPGSFTYDATGKKLVFEMEDSVSADTILLDASGLDEITVNSTTTLSLTGSTSLALGQSVTLVNNLSASLDSSQMTDYLVGRRIMQVSYDTNVLKATVSSFNSFLDSQNSLVDGEYRNVNLREGARYLDRLLRQLAATDPLMTRLDDAFTAATDTNLSGWNRRVALGQLYGEYAAYANTALSADAARFRSRWQGQNRSFLNSRLPGFLTADAGTGAGLASSSGLASPAAMYGVRDSISAGQSRIWAGGFGTWAKQDGKSNLPGYKYDSQGAVLGYEYTLGCLNLGFAAAYSRGDLKVRDLQYKNEADLLNLALYGSYVHQSGFYLEGGLGYGHGWNEYKVNSVAVPGGVKKGKYGSDLFSASAEFGYIARLPQDFAFIPSVGLDYTYSRNESWRENVSDPALLANRFASGHEHGLDIPLGFRLTRMFRFGCDGGYIVPELRAAYVYSANKSQAAVNASFVGAPGQMRMIGTDPGRSHWRIGAGVAGQLNSRVDMRLDYDFETRSGFRGHSLNAAVGLSF
ncbi:MAG: autotransporter domain-containing protein [Planctomycetes bacterium]|nr:autotransporter domain-containing protein [Planctomycetota bacterium]